MSEASELLLWGIVVHLVADWLLQNEWQAVNKMKRREADRILSDSPYHGEIERDGTRWWDRHPAAYVHAGIHTALLLLVFPPLAAVALGVSHLLIDSRWIVAEWSKLIRQTQPSGDGFDIGADVRIWVDQVWHIAALAIAALVVGA